MSRELDSAIRILTFMGRYRKAKREAFAWGILAGFALGTVLALVIRHVS